MVAARRIREGEGVLLRDLRLAALSETPDAFAATHADEANRTMVEWELRARLAAEGAERITVIGELDGRALGLAGGYWPDRLAPEVDIVSMWVQPLARGKGLGRALILAVIDWASVNGARSVGLWVTDGNDAALGLYRSVGFSGTGQTQALPSNPTKSELRMVRAVPDGTQ